MALTGQGAVVIWGDLGEVSQAAHDDWHSHEHLPERVGIPGFRRGRRAISVDGSAPQVFVMYEVDDLATLTSPAYLERLNRPTAWSTRMMGSVKQLTRTLCQVTASHGGGVGGHALTLALEPDPQRPGMLREWLLHKLLPGLPVRAGLTGAHLLERAAGAQPPTTEEQRVRARPDLGAHTIVLIEGYDPAVVRRLLDDRLAPARLREHGASEAIQVGCWQLAHVMLPGDLPGVPTDSTGDRR